jgi:bifunctional aspartokinase / homoserine dehydrogenase 1
MAIDPAGLSLTSWKEQFESSAKPADLQRLTNDLGGMTEDTVVFDCTAAEQPCDLYSKWMEKGVHVITPNKKLHSGPLERYSAVRALQAQGAAHYFYEVHPVFFL